MPATLGAHVALIVSECQRGIVEPGMGGFEGLVEQVRNRGILPRTAELADAFRRASAPVMHLPIIHRSDFADVMPNSLLAVRARKNRLLISGTPEADFAAELAPQPQDFIVARSSGLIGFNGTSLDAMLRRMGVTTIVMTGVSTNVAVAGCVLTAADLGYHVIVAEDCTAAADARTHEVIIRDQLRMAARIATAADIKAALS